MIGAATSFFAELSACGRPSTTHRSYGMDLLRWFRFLWAVRVGWDEATRVEARDFCRWLQVADKPARPHWRYPGGGGPGCGYGSLQKAGAPNEVTGKRSPGVGYDASTAAHSESVLRGFYDFHLEAWDRADGEPVPDVAASGRSGRHHNPMDPFLRAAQRPVPAEGGSAGAAVHPG